MSYFLPLEVVDRGSETQLQVGENLNAITWLVKGYIKSVPIARTAVLAFGLGFTILYRVLLELKGAMCHKVTHNTPSFR